MFEFDDKKLGYTAIVYVMESTNSVIVHFDGFDNLKECNNFSHQIMDDLGIETLFSSQNMVCLESRTLSLLLTSLFDMDTTTVRVVLSINWQRETTKMKRSIDD